MNSGKSISAPHKEFGKTKMVPVVVYLNGSEIESATWEETLWIERGEEMYALLSSGLKNKKVRVVDRNIWLRSPDA